MKKLLLTFCLLGIFSLCEGKNGTYTVDSHGVVTVGSEKSKLDAFKKPSLPRTMKPTPEELNLPTSGRK